MPFLPHGDKRTIDVLALGAQAALSRQSHPLAQRTGPDHRRAGRHHPGAQAAIRGDDRGARSGQGGDQGVPVALGRLNPYPRNGLHCPGGSLDDQDDLDEPGELSRVDGASDLVAQSLGGAGPVPPPTVGPGPDDVGRIDDQNLVA
jgi:hypothetical protein